MSKLKVDELRSADRSVSDSANITLADDGNTSLGGTLSAGTIGNNVAVEGSFGVTDISSSFTIDSDWNTWFTGKFWHFNGFVFVTFGAYVAGSDLDTSSDTIYTIANPYRPGAAHYAPTLAYEGDRGTYVQFNTNGNVDVLHATNLGGSNFYVVVNAFYRT